MTENEARQAVCPYRFGRNQPYCLASLCMAWRWNEPMINGPDSYVSEPGPTGYCGLAGKENDNG